MNIISHCARCKIPKNERICQSRDGKGPKFCPTLNFADLIAAITDEYQCPEFKTFAQLASIQEAECYAHRAAGPYVLQPEKCRIQETMEFAVKIGAKKLGLAFCGGLQREAEMLCDILETKGFEVFSVCCNAGGVPKEAIGIGENQKVHIGEYETMCNPLFQAEVLNQAGTDFNIVLGLCVGHDSLFFKKTTAMCTVLAAKDRVTGHNPLAALYTVHSYYQKLKHQN